jgi:hypothetical protein
VEPQDVLELIRSAPERYETVRAALRYRGDGPTIKALRERYLASEAGSAKPGAHRRPSKKVSPPSPTVPSAGAAGCGTRV